MAVIMPVHLCDDIFIIALYKKIINTGRKIKNAENINPKSAGLKCPQKLDNMI